MRRHLPTAVGAPRGVEGGVTPLPRSVHPPLGEPRLQGVGVAGFRGVLCRAPSPQSPSSSCEPGARRAPAPTSCRGDRPPLGLSGLTEVTQVVGRNPRCAPSAGSNTRFPALSDGHCPLSANCLAVPTHSVSMGSMNVPQFLYSHGGAGGPPKSASPTASPTLPAGGVRGAEGLQQRLRPVGGHGWFSAVPGTAGSRPAVSPGPRRDMGVVDGGAGRAGLESGQEGTVGPGGLENVAGPGEMEEPGGARVSYGLGSASRVTALTAETDSAPLTWKMHVSRGTPSRTRHGLSRPGRRGATPRASVPGTGTNGLGPFLGRGGGYRDASARRGQSFRERRTCPRPPASNTGGQAPELCLQTRHDVAPHCP